MPFHSPRDRVNPYISSGLALGGFAMTDLTGQTVLVTGASTGIGAAAAIALAEAGCDVGINYCKSKRAAQAVAKKVALYVAACMRERRKLLDTPH